MPEKSTPLPQPVREGEAFLTLAETISSLIALLQGDKTVYVNPAGCHLLGYPRNQFVGRNFWEVVDPRDQEAARARGRARQQGLEQPQRFVGRLRHADGHEVWVDYSVDTIDLGGKLTTLITGRDITEMKKAEDALRKSEALFRGLFLNSPVMMCSVDKEHRFREVSDYWLQKLGYERQELIGRHAWNYLPVESLGRFWAIIEQKQKNRDWSVRDVPLQVFRKDGTPMDILLSSVAELDEKGEPLGWITVAQDLSEMTQAQEALRQSEERFRAAFDNAAIGKAITGPDMKFIRVNRAFGEMLGYTQAELLENSPLKLTHPDDLAENRDMIRRLIGGETTSGRLIKRYYHKDGHLVWGDLTTTLIRDAEGKPAYFVTEVQDITERRRSEELLRDREANLAEAQKIAHVGSWDWDLVTGSVSGSDELLRIYGIDTAKTPLTSDWILAHTHPDDRAKAAEIRERVIRDASPFEYERRLIRDDGQVRSLWASGRIQTDASGRPVRAFGIIQDITERKRAEELLRDREAKLQEAQRIAHVGSWEIDLPTGRVTNSDEIYRIYGLDRGQVPLTLDYILSHTHPDDRAMAVGTMEQAIRDGKPFEYERRIIRDSGEVRVLWSSGRVDVDSAGKPVRAYGIVQDITERKRAENLLKDREARLAEAQRIAHIGSWDLDLATRNVTMSQELYQIYGVDPSSFQTTYETLMVRIHPEDRAMAAEIVANAVAKIQPCQFEHRLVRDDGEMRTLWVSARIGLDASGQPAHLFGIAQDITERKRAEELLRDREAKLAEAQMIAHVGSWEWDIAANRSIWSDEMYRIFGVEPGSSGLSREDAMQWFHPDDRERVGRLVDRAIADGAPYGFDARLLRPSGEVRDIQVLGRVSRDPAGKPLRLYGILQDITERKQTENLLKDREAKLAQAQSIAHLGSWEWDVERGTFLWSDELYRIIGEDPARFKASYEGYVSRVHPEDLAATTERVQRALQDGKPYEAEYRIVRKDGIRTVWTSLRAEKDGSGKVIRMYGIVQDITERKRAEDLIRASEHRFRSLYTQSPVMMIAFGPDGRIGEVSNFWLQTMGYERAEVLGQDGFGFLTPESAREFREAVDRNMAAGELVHRNIPLRGRRKDGTTIDLLVTSVFEMDERGQPRGAIAVAIDVSDIKRAEEAIRESEARYRALVEHAPEAIVVLDVEAGKFVDLNANMEQTFGFSREKLLTMGPLDFCPERQAGGQWSKELAWTQIGRCMKGESPVFEFVHHHSSGREIPCQIRLNRLPATGRDLVRATLIDISEQKALEEKIRHAEKMAAIGLLAAGVAHEIGNPLLALSMAAQSLERKSLDEYARKKMGLIREQIERISRIVRQMSDLARPQSVEKTSCDLNRVLERTLEVVRYDKRAKEVPIRFDPCPDVPFVQAVEDQIMQVCLNLALNALDAVAANPPSRPKSLGIYVRCLRRGDRTFVRTGFKDSGPGIPEAARAKIFQPFFTTKDPGKGTGLGLSVSYRIIEGHQGTLGFECGDGEGTEFFFELPTQEKP